MFDEIVKWVKWLLLDKITDLDLEYKGFNDFKFKI
jgi:hypothetical protein